MYVCIIRVCKIIVMLTLNYLLECNFDALKKMANEIFIVVDYKKEI